MRLSDLAHYIPIPPRGQMPNGANSYNMNPHHLEIAHKQAGLPRPATRRPFGGVYPEQSRRAQDRRGSRLCWENNLSRSQSLPLDCDPAGQTRTVVRFERVNGAIWQSTSGIL